MPLFGEFFEMRKQSWHFEFKMFHIDIIRLILTKKNKNNLPTLRYGHPHTIRTKVKDLRILVEIELLNERSETSRDIESQRTSICKLRKIPF